MPLITVPASLTYNNYIGNIKVAKISTTGTYDISLYTGEGNSYSSNKYPLIESGLSSNGTSVSSTKSLISFPINKNVPTTLDALYGKDVVVNNVTLTLTGVRSSSATPEGIKVNFYYVEVPAEIAVQAATEGNPLSPSTGILYNKKDSFKLGSATTPLIDNFTVTLDNAFYYYVKDKEYFYILVETEDQDETSNPYLDLKSGQERRLVSTDLSCTATITINYTVGKALYTECNYTLSTTALSFTQPGGSQTVNILPAPYGACLGGAWYVLNPTEYPWLSFNQIEGFGSEIIGLQITAADNSSDVARSAVIYVNDQALTITQAGFVPIGCAYSIDPRVPSSYPVSASAGTVNIPVTKSPSDCTTGSLVPTSSASWARPQVLLVRGQITLNDFDVIYEANTAPGAIERSAIITVGSTSFTLVQSNINTSCGTYAPNTYSLSVPASADTKTISVIGTPPGCSTGQWIFTSNSSWLTVNTPSGQGPGTASFSIAANAGSVARIGTLSLKAVADAGIAKVITVTQAGVGSGIIPAEPVSVTATLLSDNTTARIAVDIGVETEITGLYYRIVTNGVPGNWNTIAYLNPFSVVGFSGGNQYHFDVALIKKGVIGPFIRTVTPIQPVISTTPSGTTGIVGAKSVRATYDPITDSILLTWDLNGQTTLTGYKINYYLASGGFAYSLYTSTSPGTTYTVTDLSGFSRDQSYIFSIALIRNDEISSYSPSNSVFIPLSNVTGRELKIEPKLFHYPYPNINSNEYKPITHLVSRRTLGVDAVDYRSLYSDEYVDAIYSDDAVRAGFVNSVLSLTNSYNDKTTTSTTWNYENRVGLFYFELPSDSFIESPYLYFYFAAEPLGIPFDSDGVYFDIYTVPTNLIEEQGDQLKVDKKAYLTSIYTPSIIDEADRIRIKDIKVKNPVVVKIPIKIQNDAIYITASGKKILPIKIAVTLPKDFVLPTGFNAVAFTKAINSAPANNSGIGFAGLVSYIERPVDFGIKPVLDDINIYWTNSSSEKVTKYEITLSAPGFSLPLVKVVPANVLHDVTPYTLSEALLGTGYAVSAQSYTIKMRSLTDVSTDSSDYTYSLSATPYTGSVPDEIPPFPPLNIDAFYGPEKVFVSWDAPNVDLDTPIYKFKVYASSDTTTFDVGASLVNSYIDQNNIKYEKYGIELNKDNANIQNGEIYYFAVSSVSAAGESNVQLSTSVLPNAIKRQQVVDNNKYKVFYEDPVELVDPATLGQPLYPEYVEGHSSIFGDLVDKYDYLLASKDVGPSVTFTDVRNICRFKVGYYTGEDEIFIVNFPVGTYTSAAVLQFIQSAITSNIFNGETLPIIAGLASANRIFIQHTYTYPEATLSFVSGYNDANNLVFGLEPIVASPNVIVKVENYVPTVEYDKTALRSLSDSRPHKKVVKRFDIVPASKTATSTTKYPLSFNLNADKRIQNGDKYILLTNQYDDIRVGSVLIEWYVDEIKETLFDNGDGYLLSLPKVDACGNKVPSQSLGVLDYASGIISCNLPNITSGYVVVTYLINEKVSNPQEYVWMPTPHYALELNLYEPVFFTYPHYAYIMQNQAKLKPGYTILEYLKINANITSDLSDIDSELTVDIT